MVAPGPHLKEFLASIPIFGGLDDRTLDRVVAMLDEQKYSSGAVVCREGEMGRAMYVVADGEVVVTRAGGDGGRVKMVRLGPGEFFGELALIDPQPRSASVEVERDATLLALTCRDLYQLYREDLNGYVMVIQNLCRELARRLRRADERICEMASLADEDDADITQIRPSPFARKSRGARP
ncbi:MAG: cyclic nucleotide-binding domain-containing protein [Myxococcaceae bacterium]|nr:cyclic nucleotide-binding domain-containing protein [Myxococcaceae bacterium]